MKNTYMRVRLKKNGIVNHVVRKVLTEGRVLIKYDFVLPIQQLRDGKEVRFGTEEGGVRLFPCLDTDFKTINVVAQTYGTLREQMRDMDWVVDGDSALDVKEAEEVNNTSKRLQREATSIAAGRECVTPDTVVQCPQCSYEFRIGKMLSSMKMRKGENG